MSCAHQRWLEAPYQEQADRDYQIERLAESEYETVERELRAAVTKQDHNACTLGEVTEHIAEKLDGKAMLPLIDAWLKKDNAALGALVFKMLNDAAGALSDVRVEKILEGK